MILGSVTQTANGKEQVFALPYVYALLQNKETSRYSKVFEVKLYKAAEFGVTVDVTQITVIADSELNE